ncbi:MAG: Na+/H+ antiporter NhaA [Saprospiraceae bacterium]
MPEPFIQRSPADKLVLDPIKQFINNSTMSGIILFSSATAAIIISNSPLAESFHHFWQTEITIGFGSNVLTKDLHHWINDGLMAIFFFVVGLELKREIISGELSEPKNAILPISAAVCGMVVPALIYLFFNRGTVSSSGWGIPMATDIAFALGILYLLGDRVPLSLKVFLTALAIADDLGAVLVIAFFYTSDIHFWNIFIAIVFLGILIIANMMGFRNTIFYAVVGIGGLWLAFLLSGVHATIAAVLAAFTIPARVKIPEEVFSTRLQELNESFDNAKTHDFSTITHEQLDILQKIEILTKKAQTPLQRLEHRMHPLVAFVIMPVFALANAGIPLHGDIVSAFYDPVSMGIFFGLLAGKVLGVVGISYALIRLKIAPLPDGMNTYHLWGAGFLAAIGFTMSLFITDLAFVDVEQVYHAKIGILSASILASFIGYFLIKIGNRSEVVGI